MKAKSVFNSMLAGAAVLTMAVCFTSCKKNDVDATGSANLKVVNASPSSAAQSFYVANKTVVNGGLGYGNESDYIAANSGNNLDLQFRNAGSATAYATGNFTLNSGSNYTVFLAVDGMAARVKLFADDLSAPVSGQAKVRFVHVSDGAPATIDIRTAGGANLVASLARDAASSYLNIAPGVVSLQLFAAGGSTSLGSFDLTAFTAGKIYTVYVSGAATGSIAVKRISHN